MRYIYCDFKENKFQDLTVAVLSDANVAQMKPKNFRNEVAQVNHKKVLAYSTSNWFHSRPVGHINWKAIPI